MPYGTIKVDNITFTNGGSDTTITVSGLASSTTGNLTVTGTISGAVVRATTVSGVTVTGTTVQGASGTFTSITGGVATITSGVFAAGSATNPSISFTGDDNTGIYSPGADQVAVATNGTARLYIASDGKVGVGSTSPAYSLDISGAQGNINVTSTTGTNNALLRLNNTGGTGYIGLDSSAGGLGGAYSFNVWHSGSYPIVFANNNTERARVDSSGRLLVGTSSARSGFYGDATVVPAFQLEGVSNAYNDSKRFFSHTYNSATNYGPGIYLTKTRSTSLGGFTIVNSGDELGSIVFSGADGSTTHPAAVIQGFVDGTPGANDMPGRLVFSTTADGASSPTERMRITSTGYLKVSNTGTYYDVTSTGTYHELTNNVISLPVLAIICRTASFGSDVLSQGCFRAANIGWTCAKFFSGDGATNAFSDTEFAFRGDGNSFADGSWNGGGADYAEYFEWSDSNPDEEDRRGISVVLDGDKIRQAVAGEDPIGVISGNPSVVGDAAWNKWTGKYLRDEFGTYIQEDYEVTDEDGNTLIQQRRKLNPAYDPEAEYIPREQRPEWDCVGLMGKLRIRKGQITGSRWIKMRDISDSVEEWLVR
jgi:hypothetical protein